MNRKRHSNKRKANQKAPQGAQQYSYVVGRNPAFEVLRNSPRRVKKAFLSSPNEKDSRFQEVLGLLKEHRVPLEETDAEQLFAMSETKGHQGIVLEVTARGSEGLDHFLERIAAKERVCVAVCDTIFDPRNLGTIFRAAECFGIDALLWSKNRGSGITAVVSKTSVGASEIVPYIEVSNTARAIEKLQEAGFWVVVADIGEDAQSLPEFSFPEKCVFVLGSEGAGIRSLLLKKADFKVSIPLNGVIDSLNVSQAASVFFYAYAQSRVGS